MCHWGEGGPGGVLDGGVKSKARLSVLPPLGFRILQAAWLQASLCELKNYRTLTKQAVRRLNIKRSSAQSREEDEGARKGGEEER